ncbi:MAG TPA: sulfatase-like hydrolase/transferase [Bryobacteraceae bacterium]|nr:sulfatase-like hydrolase/transferase [Bryobacteraceae bacterium]
MMEELIDRRTFLFTPFALAAAHAADRKPNILLIIAGNWRAQAVPWAGDPDVMAPNLARLGAESVTFSRAYACSPRSDPARAALLTGRYPHASGPVSNPLAGLSTAGYRIGVFGDRQMDDVVSFLHAGDQAPFLVEWTLNNGSGFAERFDPDNLHVRENVPSTSETDSRRRLADFYGRCPARDREIGVVLAALDRPGMVEDTIVVFASDHGEQFGSHGLQGDDVPYEESARIALAIRYPRAIPKGAANDMLVSQADIVPTLLTTCAARVPGEMQGRDLSGQIFEQKGDRPDAVYAEGKLGHKDEWRMLVHGYDKIVTDLEGHVTHLYNLSDDPNELNNLALVSAEQLKRDSLLAEEQVWMRRLGDRVDPSGLRKR